MSRRGLDFVRAWTDLHIDPSVVYPYPSKRAALLAEACEAAARTACIGRQEIEDEVGPLDEALLRVLEVRSCGFRADPVASDPGARTGPSPTANNVDEHQERSQEDAVSIATDK